jgi:hypothetical protein
MGYTKGNQWIREGYAKIATIISKVFPTHTTANAK